MIEGLWIVQYVGLQGSGGGVVVLKDGLALGGDTGYTYVGTYSVRDQSLTTTIRVSNFLPQVSNVLGIVGDFDLKLVMPVNEETMQGSMSLVGRPGAGIAVKLTKKMNYPK